MVKVVTEDFQTYTLPLVYVLHQHTKADLLEICRSHGIQRISRLNKDDLIEAMAEQLPSKMAEKMLYWDQSVYDLMNYMVMERDPIYPFDPEEPDDVEGYLLDESIGFAFHVERERFVLETLVVPGEFQRAFFSLNDDLYQQLVKRNTKVLRLTQGLLYYYGILTPTELAHFLNPLLDEPLVLDEIARIVAEMGHYTWHIYWDGERYSDHQMLNPDYTLAEREERGDLEYRKLTYDEVWQAGDPEFSTSTNEMQALAKFLLDRRPQLETMELIDSFFGLLQSDLEPTGILPGVAEFLELESDQDLRELAYLIFECYNNTPLWVLKGHAPAQLARSSLDNVYNLATKKKVGRNDPCPCGSGLKFKRCCGKN